MKDDKVIRRKMYLIKQISKVVAEPSDASGYYQRAMSWRQKVKDYLKTGMQD